MGGCLWYEKGCTKCTVWGSFWATLYHVARDLSVQFVQIVLVCGNGFWRANRPHSSCLVNVCNLPEARCAHVTWICGYQVRKSRLRFSFVAKKGSSEILPGFTSWQFRMSSSYFKTSNLLAQFLCAQNGLNLRWTLGIRGRNLRWYFSTPTVITFRVSFELLLFLTSNVKFFEC
jgi:hypothetical protein